jgi:hypothetical protein
MPHHPSIFSAGGGIQENSYKKKQEKRPRKDETTYTGDGIPVNARLL